jgi:hypothetical protein
MCVAAALREVQRHFWDTTTQTREMFVRRPDSVPLAPAAVRVAAECSRRWNVASTDTFELNGLLRAALLANDDRTVTATLARLHALAAAKPVPERVEQYLQLIRIFLMTYPLTPARFEAAQAERRAIEALPNAPTWSRVLAAHFILEATRITANGPYALMLGDTIIRKVEAIPEDSQFVMNVKYMASGGFAHASSALVGLPVGQLNTATFKAAVERGIAEFTKLAGTNPWPRGYDDYLDKHHVYPTFLPIHPTYWLNRPDTTTPWPQIGVPTILVRAQQNCGDHCVDTYARIRRMYETFAPKGVQFILVTNTQGYSRKSLSQSVREEVDSIKSYFNHRLGAAIPIAVFESQFGTTPDGRRYPIEESKENFAATIPEGTWFNLVTKSGQIVSSVLAHTTTEDIIGEPFLMNFIDVQRNAGPPKRPSLSR